MPRLTCTLGSRAASAGSSATARASLKAGWASVDWPAAKQALPSLKSGLASPGRARLACLKLLAASTCCFLRPRGVTSVSCSMFRGPAGCTVLDTFLTLFFSSFAAKTWQQPSLKRGLTSSGEAKLALQSCFGSLKCFSLLASTRLPLQVRR